MGRVKSKFCNEIALRTWEFCIARKLWTSAAHIPGAEKKEADEQPRILKDAVE